MNRIVLEIPIPSLIITKQRGGKRKMQPRQASIHARLAPGGCAGQNRDSKNRIHSRFKLNKFTKVLAFGFPVRFDGPNSNHNHMEVHFFGVCMHLFPDQFFSGARFHAKLFSVRL